MLPRRPAHLEPQLGGLGVPDPLDGDGQRVDDMSQGELLRVRADIGMLFQESALFDSLTVAENVGYWYACHDDPTGI